MDPQEFIYQMLEIDLNAAMADVFNTVMMLDRIYMNKKENYYMKYVHMTNRTLGDILVFELVNFLSKLAVSDSEFSEVELQFMMENIPLQVNREQFIGLCNTCLNEFSDDVPESLLLFMEDDNVIGNISARNNNSFNPNNAEKLYLLFNVIGVHFIACDGEVDFNEYKVFQECMNEFRNIMDNFNIEKLSNHYKKQIEEEFGIRYDEDVKEKQAPKEETVHSGPNFCSECGAKVDAGSNFCHKCGFKLV